MYDRELTDDELELLRIAGANEDLIRFVDIFPQSTVGQNILGWFERGDLTSENAGDGQPYSGGHFFDIFWSGDTEKAFQWADLNNQKHMKTLFGEPVRNEMEPAV